MVQKSPCFSFNELTERDNFILKIGLLRVGILAFIWSKVCGRLWAPRHIMIKISLLGYRYNLKKSSRHE